MNPGGKGVPKNRGSNHPAAKLDDYKVEQIRGFLSMGKKHRWIAWYFRVSTATISHIATGKKWKHVRSENGKR
jgi:hypothetical protein